MMNSSSSTTAAPATNNLTSSAASNAPPPQGVKTYFKTAEGKYKLQYEKTHPTLLIHNPHTKTVTQVTLCHLKEKPAGASSQSSSSGPGPIRSAAARFLGGGNGTKSLSFGGSNGVTKPANTGCTRIGSLGSLTSSSNLTSNSSFNARGTYLVFNVQDLIFFSDLNSKDKDPIKSIHFSNSNPVCHAYDPDAKEDGHNLLIGLTSGDVYSVSLRQQLQDVGKKLVGAQHYNKEGAINSSRCTCVAWIPNGNGTFVVAHSDGNMYVYEKNKDASGDPAFPPIKDQTQFLVSHSRNSKNPVARWHICEGSINGIAFSGDGAHVATIGRDGYLRVFDYKREQLIFGGKSYYGALLCCAWSDGKYILTGGEDDLVQVWSMQERKIVAWGEGHNSWVSSVAFDPYWVAPSSDTINEEIVYRFGSVGQDGQLLLWDFEIDELIVPIRRTSAGSPIFSPGSQSSRWDTACPVGTLHPAPSIRNVPKLSPLVAHRVHSEPLSSLIFTQESVLTACREGHVKVWARPSSSESHLETPIPGNKVFPVSNNDSKS